MSRKDGIGCVHIYTGDGKGKTTAAVGLAVRCAGGGGRVLFCQFMKGEHSGERDALRRISGVDVLPVPDTVKFYRDMTEEERLSAAMYYGEVFEKVCGRAGDYDMLVFDELIPAVCRGYISTGSVLKFLDERPAGLGVVMTGRGADDRLIGGADYVTEMRKIKHPFDKGLKMRRFIEV